MFPDIRPMQKSQNQSSRKSDLPWFMLLVLAALAVTAVHLYSMLKLSEIGLLPGVGFSGMAIQFPLANTVAKEAPVIPVTGSSIPNIGDRIYLDDFDTGIKDWSAVEGTIHSQDDALTLSPGWFGFGGITAWNLPDQMLPVQYAFSAQINTDAQYGEVYGLAINLNTDLKEIYFAVDPAARSAAILQREDGSTSVISPWQTSDAVLPYPETNLLTAECSSAGMRFYVNDSLVSSADYTQPCNQGQVGVFVRAPGWMIRIIETQLYTVQ